MWSWRVSPSIQHFHCVEHLHFHCVEGQLMFLGRGPTFSAIEGDWANYGLVDLCLEIFWHFLITQDSGDLSPLEPSRVDSCSCVRDGVASDMTRDPRNLNWAVFFNLMLKLGDVPPEHLTMLEVLWYSSWTHFTYSSGMPCSLRARQMRSWGTWSNAFSRSRKAMCTVLYFS